MVSSETIARRPTSGFSPDGCGGTPTLQFARWLVEHGRLNEEQGTLETVEQDVRRIPDARLWQLRTAARAALVEYTHPRLARQLATSGAPPGVVDEAKGLFDPDTLTLGFARRFASY
ncbi:MAG TPA: hypothetical protein VMW65_03130 [Chloroflexota bacterium]|nr:hypothetical protein [Chloroflexota bacterium]